MVEGLGNIIGSDGRNGNESPTPRMAVGVRTYILSPTIL